MIHYNTVSLALNHATPNKAINSAHVDKHAISQNATPYEPVKYIQEVSSRPKAADGIEGFYRSTRLG